LSPDEVERLSDLLESGDRREGPTGTADGDVEVLFDEVDDMWMFIKFGETAHFDGRYIRSWPEIVVSVQELL